MIQSSVESERNENEEIEMTNIDLNSPRIVPTNMNQVPVIRAKRDSSEIKQDVKPLRIVYYIINHPCKIICTFLFLCTIMIIFDAMVFELSRSSTDGREWFVRNSDEVHKFNIGMQAPDDVSSAKANPVTPQTKKDSWLTLVTVFKTKDGSNILMSDYMNFISEINNKIINTDNEEYKKLCYVDSQSYPNCSTSAYVDPLILGITAAGYDVNTITDTELSTIITSLINTNDDQIYVSFEESFATSNDGESQYYRAFFQFGLPYPDINNTHSSFQSGTDKYLEQLEFYDAFVTPIWEDIQLKSNNHENIEVVLFGQRMHDIVFAMLREAGNLWAGASVAIVWFIMFCHMKSLFLSSAAMLQIILGFPFSYFLYRIVFRVTYFGLLQGIIIFVILGIAADDCFVFVDAWIQSEQIVKNPLNIVERMSYTYKRAGYAMFVTTSMYIYIYNN